MALSIGGAIAAAGAASATVPIVGQLTVVAGTGTAGTPTPGPADRSMLDEPFGMAIDGAGNLYIADALNHRVEKVSPSGTLSIFAGTGVKGTTKPGPATKSPMFYPDGVAVGKGGVVYIADAGNHVIDKVSPSGTLSIIAGTGKPGPSTPGPATHSDLNYPYGLAVTPSGYLYIADTFSDEVDGVAPNGTLSIIAGTGITGPVTAGPARKSRLDKPTGVAVGPTGNLYISDTFGSEIVKITPAGTLSVFAGTGAGGKETPGPAIHSQLDYCYDVTVDASGDVYIADTFNHVIDEVTPSGYLSVIAGTGVAGTPTAGPATKRELSEPDGVVLDGSGNLYVSDYMTNDVVKIVAPVVGIAAPSHGGYLDATSSGRVHNHGTAFHGAAFPGHGTLPSPVAGVAAKADGAYVLTTAAGTVTAYGMAFHGSPAASHAKLASPVVGIAATSSGYLLATAKGAVYAYGTPFHGSPGASHLRLTSPVTGIAATPGGGYLLVTTGGTVYAYGTPFHGSPHSRHIRPTTQISGIAVTGTGGYVLATTGGAVYHYGTPAHGSPASRGTTLTAPVVGIAATPGGGYYLTTSAGTVYSY